MLAQRMRQPEIMDDPNLASAEHVAALRGLRRVHQLTGTVGRLWQPMNRLISTQRLKQLSVLDVGCGDGWILRQLWKRARRAGCDLQLQGCDFSLRALDLCQQACEREAIPIRVHKLDVTREALPGPVDVVVNSMFLHHFADGEVQQLLAQFDSTARRLWIMEDLVRSSLGYGLCVAGVRALTRCRVVHVDGPLSVKAAFTLPEMEQLLQRAKIQTARLVKCWPERMLITRWVDPSTTAPNHQREGHGGQHN
jgi:2-polyprenyl-3-methyl-5-hydroxy-6-metoxy-1,4-benzoquinol methylase